MEFVPVPSLFVPIAAFVPLRPLPARVPTLASSLLALELPLEATYTFNDFRAYEAYPLPPHEAKVPIGVLKLVIALHFTQVEREKGAEPTGRADCKLDKFEINFPPVLDIIASTGTVDGLSLTQYVKGLEEELIMVENAATPSRLEPEI
jgi:hypothetical protein